MLLTTAELKDLLYIRSTYSPENDSETRDENVFRDSSCHSNNNNDEFDDNNFEDEDVLALSENELMEVIRKERTTLVRISKQHDSRKFKSEKEMSSIKNIPEVSDNITHNPLVTIVEMI